MSEELIVPVNGMPTEEAKINLPTEQEKSPLQKVGKWVSTILIIALIVIGVVLAFLTKEGKWSFYFFGTAVILVVLFSLFVFLGTISKNNSIVKSIGDAIKQGIQDPVMLTTIAGIFRKTPYPYMPSQVQQTSVNNPSTPGTPAGVPHL